VAKKQLEKRPIVAKNIDVPRRGLGGNFVTVGSPLILQEILGYRELIANGKLNVNNMNRVQKVGAIIMKKLL
jgi:hypothetical protein